MANLAKEWAIFKSWNACQWMIVDLFYLHICMMRNDSQCGFKVCKRIYLCKIIQNFTHIVDAKVIDFTKSYGYFIHLLQMYNM
jgi:hypothetical protein